MHVLLFICCSVAKLCLTLWDTMDCRTPGFPPFFHHNWVYVNEMTFGKHQRYWPIARGTNPVIRSYNIQSKPLLLLPGKGENVEFESTTRCQWLNQSCLCNEASINTRKGWDLESFRLGEHMKILGEWSTRREHGDSSPILHTLSYVIQLTVSELHPLIIN